MSEKSHTAANSTITLRPLSPTHCKFTWWRLTSLSSQCDCTYAQAHKLQKHKMTHTGEKAQVYTNVTIPSLAYTLASRVEDLQIQPVRLHLHTWVANFHTHTLTHTEVRPYNCDQCIKAFTRKSYHTKHSSSQAQLYEHKEAHFLLRGLLDLIFNRELAMLVYLCFWVGFLKPKTSCKNIALFA